MTERVKILAEQIRQLTLAERDELLQHLGWIDDGEPDGTPEEIEQAWIEEVERRIASVERGESKLIDIDDAITMARARLASR